MRLVRSFGFVLDDCLAAMRAGESVEACLARYPRQADRLRPLLQMAQQVSRTPHVRARPWAEATAWHVVRQRAAELRSGRRRRVVGLHYGAWLKPIAMAAVLVLAVLGAGGGTVLAAQNALPDSPLYRVKLASEDVRLWFVFSDTQKANILLDQSNTRVEEMMSLVQRGKPIPDNLLSALQDRNERAARIEQSHPSDTGLRARLLSQAQTEEQLLVALWPDVSQSARLEYTQAVATIHNTRLQGGGTGAAVAAISPEDLSGGVLDISGQAQAVGNGIWRIGGVEVRVDNRTIGFEELKEGTKIRFVVGRASNGRLQALSLSGLTGDVTATGSVVSGAIEQVTDQGIRVAGHFYPVTPDTLIKLQLREGERVDLTLGSTASGGVAVTTVAPAGFDQTTAQGNTFTYEGTIQGDIDRSNEWTIGGLQFVLTSATSVDAKAGNATPGARVQVQAVDQDGQLEAQQLTVLASNAAPDSSFLVGTFGGVKDGYWQVSGLDVVPPAADQPDRGALTALDIRLAGRQVVAVRVAITESPQSSDLLRFTGSVQNIQGSLWTLPMGQVRVTSKADVAGTPVVGGRVLGWARLGRDGVEEAVFVRALDNQAVAPLATSSPSPTPTPSPSATPSPSH